MGQAGRGPMAGELVEHLLKPQSLKGGAVAQQNGLATLNQTSAQGTVLQELGSSLNQVSRIGKTNQRVAAMAMEAIGQGTPIDNESRPHGHGRQLPLTQVRAPIGGGQMHHHRRIRHGLLPTRPGPGGEFTATGESGR